MVGVAPFVLMGVFSSTMQLRGRPGLEYSDAGLRGREREKVRKDRGEWKSAEKEEVIAPKTNSRKSISSIQEVFMCYLEDLYKAANKQTIKGSHTETA